MTAETQSRRDAWLAFAGICASVALWWLLAAVADVETIVPGPTRTASAAVNLLRDGYGIDLAATAIRSAIAWVVALLVGVPCGLLLGLSARSLAASRGVLAFARSLPAFMLIAVAVGLRLGGETSRIGTALFACAVVAIDMTAEAAARRSKDRSDLFRVYGAGRLFTVSRLLFFETLGQVIVPLARSLVGLAMIVTVVCETLVIPRDGVGARLVTALSEADLTGVYAFLLLTGVMACLLNYVIVVLARRLVYWG